MKTPNTFRTRCAARFLLACTVVISPLFATVAFAQSAAPPSTAPVEIEFGYPEQPPRIFTNAQGKPDGVIAQFVAELFSKAGVPWRAVSYPASRLFINLENGTTTFSVLVRSPTVMDCCLINKNPLYITALNTYYIGDKPPIKNRHDLIGKRIIILRGFSYSGLINFINDPQNKILSEVAPTHESAFEMLAAGRADYLLNYDRSANVVLAANPIANLRHDTIDRVETHIVLSKKYPDAEKVMERFESTLKSIDTNNYFK